MPSPNKPLMQSIIFNQHISPQSSLWSILSGKKSPSQMYLLRWLNASQKQLMFFFCSFFSLSLFDRKIEPYPSDHTLCTSQNLKYGDENLAQDFCCCCCSLSLSHCSNSNRSSIVLVSIRLTYLTTVQGSFWRKIQTQYGTDPWIDLFRGLWIK